jgi:hypothetical protein
VAQLPPLPLQRLLRLRLLLLAAPRGIPCGAPTSSTTTTNTAAAAAASSARKECE